MRNIYSQLTGSHLSSCHIEQNRKSAVEVLFKTDTSSTED